MRLATKGEIFEYLISEAYRSVVRPGDICIDVGANRGDHLKPLAELVGRDGHVYAFEPNPALYTRLGQWIEETSAPVTLRPFAVGSTYEQSSIFNVNSQNASNYSGLRQQTMKGCEYSVLRTSTCTLDDCLSKLPALRFCKFDVDGGEVDVLRGARSLVARHKPIIVFEFGDCGLAPYGVTSSEMFQLFSELGYSVSTITGVPISTVKAFAESSQLQEVWNYVAVHQSETPVFHSLTQRLSDIYGALIRDTSLDSSNARAEFVLKTSSPVVFNSAYDFHQIGFTLRNLGRLAFTNAYLDSSGRGHLQIGLRWQRNGAYVTEERRPLPCTILPGEETTRAFDLYTWQSENAFLSPGNYTLTVQIVSEHVAWLHDKAKLNVRITG